MSSILRALKKLENEPRHLEESQTLDSKFVPLAETRPSRKSAGLLLGIIGGSIIFGLVVLAGIWWLLSEKNQQTPAPPREIARQETQTVPVIQEKSVILPKPKSPAAVNTSSFPAEQAADLPAVQQTEDRIPAPIQVPLPQPPSPAIEQGKVLSVAEQPAEPSSVSSPPSTAETIKPAATEEVPAAETSQGEIMVPQVEKVEIPVLKNAEVKLQAITWSKDPQKRIAVINNSILRQGDTVSGYRIQVINQDDVVLNDRGQQWKLVFRIR